MTAPRCRPNRRMASASSSEIRGLPRAASISASVIKRLVRSIVKESEPNSDTMAPLISASTPRMSETTAMMDATETILPRIVSADLSLLAQMACSAMPVRSAARRIFHHLDGIAISEGSDVGEWPRDDQLASIDTRESFEIAVARNAGFDGDEHRQVFSCYKYAFELLHGAGTVGRLECLISRGFATASE